MDKIYAYKFCVMGYTLTSGKPPSDSASNSELGTYTQPNITGYNIKEFNIGNLLKQTPPASLAYSRIQWRTQGGDK